MICRRIACLALLSTVRLWAGQPSTTLTVTVVDENSVGVPAALITLQPQSASDLHCETSFAGRCEFSSLAAGTADLRAEKEGFYTVVLRQIQIGATTGVEVTLSHLQEVKEVVNVVESPLAVDPGKTQAQEQLTGMDIINIPYPSTNDYRNVLNFIPGVQQDPSGQPHLGGSETYQNLTLFDGFNVTQPSNGQLLLRVATDALRSILVQTSRYSAEYGKGSGGVLDLRTGTGNDDYRFLATDFIPSIQNKKGVALNEVNPRFIVSGPIRKGEVWFFDAVDIDYQNIVVPELPAGADSDVTVRWGNFIKLQANVTSRNILTGGFNYNYDHDPYSGISPSNPQSATPEVNQPAYQASLKDQHYFSGGDLLETGFGWNRYDLDATPHGTDPYFLNPETAGGSYYLSARTRATRWQLLTNFYLHPSHWYGQHDLQVGADLDRIRYDASYSRQPIYYLQEGYTAPPSNGCATNPTPCTRYSTFPGTPMSTTDNTEVSAYAQDRWLLHSRFLVEGGLRYDWNQIIRRSLISPRFSTTYVLDSTGKTKVSAGFGMFYDATPIFLIARPRAGSRLDVFFPATGGTIGPIASTFTANTTTLQAPRFINWSLALERQLPAAIYLKVEYIQKRGTDGLVYDLVDSTTFNGNFVLQNTRQDHYDAFQLGARRAFPHGHMLFASYMRSHSRSNQVLDFSVDNPQFSPQQPGPYPWDAPNRFLSWGLLPIYKGFDFAYSTELRSGFPFNVVNDQLQLVEPPGSRRFPTWFTLNTHIEKRFHAFGYHWAIRGGFNNVTGRHNYTFVNNNSDSLDFLTFGNYEGRVLTGRIRFLGKK
jgi:outer membrane receptor protein involved in Fe transport